MADGTNAQRKDLLHRVVKKVLVHDRRTLEVWYALPNRQAIEYSNNCLAGRNSVRYHRTPPPEVWFRIRHVAVDGAVDASYREQMVEIALGPKGAFENESVGAVTRRVRADRDTNLGPDPNREPDACILVTLD